MARPRKSRRQNLTAADAPSDDLYDYVRPPARRPGRPASEDPTTWTVRDDWPEDVPVTGARASSPETPLAARAVAPARAAPPAAVRLRSRRRLMRNFKDVFGPDLSRMALVPLPHGSSCGLQGAFEPVQGPQTGCTAIIGVAAQICQWLCAAYDEPGAFFIDECATALAPLRFWRR